jgi:hypothetical protein
MPNTGPTIVTEAPWSEGQDHAAQPDAGPRVELAGVEPMLSNWVPATAP